MDKNKLLAPALLVVGKREFRLDPSIPISYLFSTGIRYAAMILRGIVKSCGVKCPRGKPLIGSKVTLRCKKKLHFGAKVRLQEGVYIDALSIGGVYLGDRSMLGRNSRIECTGSLRSVGIGIRIGRDSTFGSDCYFGCAGGIEIGNDVIAGQYVRFHSENHVFHELTRPIREQGVTHRGIRIGNDVWIGAGAVFLDGAKVGDGCVVAGNAVVTGKSFPPYSVIGGTPARVLKSRRPVEKTEDSVR